MDLDNDFLDGCELDFDTEMNTDDEDVVALVLFADVEFTDKEAVTTRTEEYAALAKQGAF